MMPFQENPIFFLKRFFAMMLLLARNIGANSSNIGLADSKGSVTCLPREPGKFGALCLDPFG